MRKICLLALCLLPAASIAQDEEKKTTPQTSLTAHAPKGPVLVRLPSLDRMDAMGKALAPHLKALLPQEIATILEQGGASGMAAMRLGLADKPVDRDKPVYLAPAAGGMVVIGSSGGELLRRGGAAAMAVELRGAPTPMLGGDIAIHIFAGELIEKRKGEIEGGLQFVQMMAGGIALIPDWTRKLIPPVLDLARGGLYGVDGIDYALTLRGNVIWSEGRITTKPDSGLRQLLARAGAPDDHVLAGYLPRDALVVIDGSGHADWPGLEFSAFLDNALGEGAGRAISNLGAPDVKSWGVTSGRAAASVQLMGMMQGATTLALHQLKQGVDPKTVIDRFDVEGLNAALKKSETPVSYSVVKDAGKHGETSLHRIEITSEDPLLAIGIAMTQTYVAAEGNLLFLVNSPSAEEDIKKLIDKVRAGPDAEHPHLKAMAKLGRKRNLGVTFNLAGIKPFAPVFAMLGRPEVANMLATLPNELTVSTAVSMHEGNLHWRGDWPVEPMVALAGAMMKLATPHAGGEKQPPPDEDFD